MHIMACNIIIKNTFEVEQCNRYVHMTQLLNFIETVPISQQLETSSNSQANIYRISSFYRINHFQASNKIKVNKTAAGF